MAHATYATVILVGVGLLSSSLSPDKALGTPVRNLTVTSPLFAALPGTTHKPSLHCTENGEPKKCGYWTSSDPEVVSVDPETGEMRFGRIGKAEICVYWSYQRRTQLIMLTNDELLESEELACSVIETVDEERLARLLEPAVRP